MRKIIITGATSMIGIALTEIAIRDGIEIYAIIRPKSNRKDRIISSPLVHVVNGSLEKLSEIEELPNDCDVFYHLAWVGTGKASRDNPEIQERNIGYTMEAVKLAKKVGCHRFVGAGSQAEYGPVFGRIDENTRYAPIISYGIAKYAAAILSRKYCEQNGIDHVWGRIFSVYGPHDNEGTMLDYAIKTWNNGDIANFSSGMQSWNYLYETDAGEMFYRLGYENVPSGTYFIANHESRLLRDYIEILRSVYGTGADLSFATSQTERLPGLDVDMKRTLDILGIYPQVSFKEGIKRMIDAKTAGIQDNG